MQLACPGVHLLSVIIVKWDDLVARMEKAGREVGGWTSGRQFLQEN